MSQEHRLYVGSELSTGISFERSYRKLNLFLIANHPVFSKLIRPPILLAAFSASFSIEQKNDDWIHHDLMQSDQWANHLVTIETDS